MSFYKLLSVRAFPLEVSHGQATNDPVNLHQKNLLSVLTRKGKALKAQLSSSEPQVLPERTQISAGRSLRARNPGPANRSSPREPGAQPTWPSGSSGSSGCPNCRGSTLRPRPRQVAAIRLQRQGWGRSLPRPQGLDPASRWTWRGLWKPCRAQA